MPTFIEDAKALTFNIGGLNNGWKVAMTTLGNERGGNATTQHAVRGGAVAAGRDGPRAAADDPQSRHLAAYCTSRS